MAFFIGLVSIYLLVWSLSFLPFAKGLAGMEGIMAAAIMFCLVGISHFAKREKLEVMIPPNWPYRRAMNYVSGIAEIALAIGLLFPATRLYSAWGLILLLLAIFPANIYVAMTKKTFYNIFRLFFQPVYIAWIYWFCIAVR